MSRKMLSILSLIVLVAVPALGLGLVASRSTSDASCQECGTITSPSWGTRTACVVAKDGGYEWCAPQGDRCDLGNPCVNGGDKTCGFNSYFFGGCEPLVF